jgi:hypothetical protein
MAFLHQFMQSGLHPYILHAKNGFSRRVVLSFLLAIAIANTFSLDRAYFPLSLGILRS